MTKEKIIEILEGAKDWNGDVPFEIAVKAINKMAENIPQQPERKKGKWIPGKEISREMVSDTCLVIHYDRWVCNKCGYYCVSDKPVYNFCPECGADMRGDQ